MGENSAIEWTDHSFNPWTGCTRVSPGCHNCYAAALAKRSPATFGSWEPRGARKRTSEAYWRQPLAWNRKAEREGRRARVFCASMADAFDNQVPAEWRRDLWKLIIDTPHLDWLLLTKRPQNIAAMLPGPTAGWGKDLSDILWGKGWHNVWLGTTVENQAEADRRIPHLLAVPARVRFLSCEPLLGPVDLTRVCLAPKRPGSDRAGIHINALAGRYVESGMPYVGDWDITGPCPPASDARRIDWVIAGGESGPGARPMHPDWARTLRDQCAAAGVPFFFKQWGDWRPIREAEGDWYDSLYRSNRIALPGEDQAAVDDTYGRRCTVPSVAVHRDGSTHDLAAPGAWLAGTGAMQTFRVGKKRAGALLDGREHREIPHG